jgi:5-methylcytosine-specific restriction endonuclease McrA
VELQGARHHWRPAAGQSQSPKARRRHQRLACFSVPTARISSKVCWISRLAVKTAFKRVSDEEKLNQFKTLLRSKPDFCMPW